MTCVVRTTINGSNVRGKQNGVQKHIFNIKPRAL